MTIKDLGPRVELAWEGLRPMTKKMLAGAIEASQNTPKQTFSYDAHADWELSRLLTALDEQTGNTRSRLRSISARTDRLAASYDRGPALF
jgi:hypothetical protein